MKLQHYDNNHGIISSFIVRTCNYYAKFVPDNENNITKQEQDRHIRVLFVSRISSEIPTSEKNISYVLYDLLYIFVVYTYLFYIQYIFHLIIIIILF